MTHTCRAPAPLTFTARPARWRLDGDTSRLASTVRRGNAGREEHHDPDALLYAAKGVGAVARPRPAGTGAHCSFYILRARKGESTHASLNFGAFVHCRRDHVSVTGANYIISTGYYTQPL